MVFVTPDGKECSFRGTYLEVEPPAPIVQTWLFEGWPDAEAVETETLKETDGVTKLTVTMVFRDKAGRDYMTKHAMRLLLTSSGIANTSIHDALLGLLGKPIEESSALVIPTAIYPSPGGAGRAWEAICRRSKRPFAGLGWKSLGVLELSVLPGIDEECWVPSV